MAKLFAVHEILAKFPAADAICRILLSYVGNDQRYPIMTLGHDWPSHRQLLHGNKTINQLQMGTQCKSMSAHRNYK